MGPMLLPMITPDPTLGPLKLVMDMPLMVNTTLLCPMAVSKPSPTKLPMTTLDTSLMSNTLVNPSTPNTNPNPTSQLTPLPLPTTLLLPLTTLPLLLTTPLLTTDKK